MRRTLRASTPVVALIMMMVIVGCSSSGSEGLDLGELTDSSASLPEVELPDVTLPEVELPEVELPEAGGEGDAGADGGEGATDSGDSGTPAEPAVPADPGGQDDGFDGGVLAALLVIALGAIAVMVMMARDSSASEAAEHDRQRVVRSKVIGLLEVARWTDGQVGQLLDLPDPRTARHATATLGTYVADAESRCAQLSTEVRGAAMVSAVEGLGQAFASMRGSVSRLTTAGESDLESARTDTIHRRADLLTAAQAVRAFADNGLV